MADAAALVESFADADASSRFEAYESLVQLEDAALPAIRAGLKSENRDIRRWSAICLDQIGDEAALADLIPLLRDPVSKVRLWAVHSLACNHCKDEIVCPVDVVPHLIERIETDESLRVRRMAVIMLGTDFLDSRAAPVFRRLLREETDRKLRLHAREGLRRLVEAGLVNETG